MTIEKIARDELREQIAQTIKAQGWRAREDSSAVADALLPLITEIQAASYRAGAEDMRERMLEKTQISIDYFEMAPGAMPAKEAAACSIALKDLRQAIRSLPLPDPQPTPTQESRDV